MAKAARAICERCEHRLTTGSPYCGKCGQPTLWANHEDRVQWELAVYREKTEKAPMGVLYETPPGATRVLDRTKPARKPRLFGRKAHKATIVIPEAKPIQPPAPVLRAVEAMPEREVAQVPVREVAPKPKPVARPARSKMDKEPLRDTPATVLAMRMLNARVAELDSTIQKLQHEIEMLRRS